MPGGREGNPLEDADELRTASQDQIGEWEEVERWLPEAVGYSVYEAILTDESDLRDFMDLGEPTGEGNERGQEILGPTAESWEEARATLLRYGVDIGPRKGRSRSDTNLVSLAKRTLGRPRAAEPQAEEPDTGRREGEIS